jgi:hypothetical protein
LETQNPERLTPLLDSLDDLTRNLDDIRTRLKYAKLQLALAKNHDHKINIMLMKWKSEVDQSTYKIEKVKKEIQLLQPFAQKVG